ncbi:MAG: hypothetical protein WCC84_01635 [Candidatus Cybelea sp.]
MRLSLLCTSAALAAGLALSACSSGGGSSSALPSSSLTSSSGHTVAMGKSHGHAYTVRLMPGVKPLITGCDYSVYAFCFYITPGNPGPYVETSTAPSYQLENDGWIVKNTNARGKIDKKFDDYFYPDPGNPTYQYIDYSGRTPHRAGPVKFTDFYCIGFAPSTDCNGNYGTYTFKLGIALE